MAYTPTDESSLLYICQQVARRVSLPAPADIGSGDPAVQLLVQCANMAAHDVLNGPEYPDLLRTGSITVSAPVAPVDGQAAFALPVDWVRFVDGTQWDGQFGLNAIGPLSAQEWSACLSGGVTVGLAWQVRGGKLWVLNPPVTPASATMRFSYISRELVQDADDPTMTKNVANKNGDRFLVDPQLLIGLARVKWLESKGFDSGAALRDVMPLWDRLAGDLRGGRTHNLAGRFVNRLIDACNAPATGFGV